VILGFPYEVHASYYSSNAMLVCILSDIKSAVILFLYLSEADISAMVTPIGMKFCVMVELCPGQCFCSFGK